MCECKDLLEAIRPLVPGRRVFASRQLLADAETSHRRTIELQPAAHVKAWAITIQAFPTLDEADPVAVFAAIQHKATPENALAELATGAGLFIEAGGSRVEAAPAKLQKLTIDLCALEAADMATRAAAHVSIEVREMVSAGDDCKC